MIKKNVLVITPHPDDETLGCGGTLLRLKEKGYSTSWIIFTSISEKYGFSKVRVESRKKEINLVAKKYDFDNKVEFDIPTTKVDEISYSLLTQKISEVFNQIKPNIIFLPFYNDVHTDHRIITDATLSCTKWFRYPYIETVLFYETISETDFNINTSLKKFEPNVFIDISKYMDKKIEIMNIYESELSEFPFPRSEKAVRSAAYLRGSQCGAQAAEAFELLRSNIYL